MKVLMTGHTGYIGSVMAPIFRDAGHTVVGLDNDLFAGCFFGENPPEIPALHRDLRDVQRADLLGFDAVVHLAALSNDPLGQLQPGVYLRHQPSGVGTAGRSWPRQPECRGFFIPPRAACTVWPGTILSPRKPHSTRSQPYGESKVRAERDLVRWRTMISAPPTCATRRPMGFRPYLRVDLVVNSLVGYAYTTGEVLIQSDGTPWRPLVHVEDICRAFLAVLHAPRDLVHNQAFNVGRSEENYRIREVAQIVHDVVPGSVVKYAGDGGPDARCYRVDCGKIARTLPEFQPQWTVRTRS